MGQGIDTFEMLSASVRAVQNLWLPLLVNAIISTTVALYLALRTANGRERVTGVRIASGCAVAFLLYPRPVFVSTLQIALGKIGTLFGEAAPVGLAVSSVGFAVIFLPINVGIAYLLFTYGFDLQRALREHRHLAINIPAARKLLRSLTIAAVYAFPFLVVCGVLFAFNNLQNLPLGTSGPFTLGKYVQGLISSPSVTTFMRFQVLAAVLALVVVSVVLAPLSMRAGINWLLRQYALRHESGLVAPSKSTSTVPSTRVDALAIAFTLCLLVLHVLVVGRLGGLMGSWYEAELPALSIRVVKEMSIDIGVWSVVVVVALISVGYFFSMKHDLRVGSRLLLITVLCGLVAFLPGAMYGSVVLMSAEMLNVPNVPFWLGVWGVVVGTALWFFLMADRFFVETHHGYRNLWYLRGRLLAGGIFLRNEGMRLCLVAFLVCYWLWVDDSFRFALGVGRDSYAGLFIDRQNYWSPEHRGLALVVFISGLIVLWLTSRSGLGEGGLAKRETITE